VGRIRAEDSIVGRRPPPPQHKLVLRIDEQPSDTTCGPTALQSVYRYHGDEVPLLDLTREVPQLENGGTLGVLLGSHALRRGYRVRIYTYNLQLFDPTWFRPRDQLAERLALQAQRKRDPKVRAGSRAYLDYLALGGDVCFEELTEDLLQRLLSRDHPVLTGLSATYLYRTSRERDDCTVDDVEGDPVGHFVVLSGYDTNRGTLLVSDPYGRNPVSRSRQYHMPVERVIGAILLGALTYDANLVIVRPRAKGRRGPPDTTR
jgi:hypothetical protein